MIREIQISEMDPDRHVQPDPPDRAVNLSVDGGVATLRLARLDSAGSASEELAHVAVSATSLLHALQAAVADDAAGDAVPPPVPGPAAPTAYTPASVPAQPPLAPWAPPGVEARLGPPPVYGQQPSGIPLPDVVEYAQFLGQAAFTGVLGNAVYDGLRRGWQAVSRRWRSRQESAETSALTQDEATELATVAVRVFRQLTEDAPVEVATTPAVDGQGWWRVELRSQAGGSVDAVSVPPSDPAETTVTIRTAVPPPDSTSPASPEPGCGAG